MSGLLNSKHKPDIPFSPPPDLPVNLQMQQQAGGRRLLVR